MSLLDDLSNELSPKPAARPYGLLGDFLQLPQLPAQAQAEAMPSFDFSPTEKQQKNALWSSLARMGAAMLANNRGGFANALGHGLAAQQDGYQGALERSQNDNVNQFKTSALKDDWQEKQRTRQREAGLRQALAELPQDGSYWDRAAGLYASSGDMDTALKLKEYAGGGKATDAQKNFQYLTQMGIPPSQAMQVFTPFAPPTMQYVPGTDYKAGGVFNPRSGEFIPTEPAPQEQEPVDALAPWGSLPPKQADEMRQRVYTTESKKLDDLREQVAKGRQTMNDLNRFGQLNQQQATGGIQDRWLPNMLTMDGDKQEMLAIQSRLAPMVRPAGSGATSDKDMALYLQSLPGIDKPGDVNRSIREQFGSNLSAAERKLAFAEQYLAKHGHLNGMDQAFANLGKQPAPQQRTPAAKPVAVSAPPAGAIDYLKRNIRLKPGLAQQFDAKYGQGAAARYLGQ